MSNVFLTSAPLTPANAPTAASGVPGTIADPPPAALQLSSGSFVRGEVVGRSERGQVLVRADLGTLAVSTRAQLPTGSQVTLQIRNSGSQLHIAVLQVDGHAPQLKASPGTAPPTASVPPPPTAAPAAQAPTLPTAPASGVPGTVANPPPATGLLAPGAVLQGVVLGANESGQVLIRTDAGTLPLATSANLPSGSQVTLQVQSLVPQLNVLVAPGTSGGPPQATASQAAGTVDVLTLGQTIRAHVQGPQAAPGATTTTGLTGASAAASTPTAPGAVQGPHLHAGGTLQLTVLQVTPPGTAAGQQTPGTAAALVSSTGPQVGVAAQAGPTPGPLPSSPAPGTPPAVQTAGGVSVTGFVTGTTAAGQPQVQTGFGALTLDIKASLPPGTRLVLELPASAFDIASEPPPPASDPKSLAYRWPALDYALETLRSLDSAEVQGLMSQQGPSPALPQAGPRLTSSMLFFLTALTGGNPGNWANGWVGSLMGGQAARLLERAGQGDLLSRLNSELAQLARLSDAAGSDWRLLPMPFFDGQQIQQLRLFLRRDSGGGSAGGEGEEATRFVLEVSLTRLGDLQLDGLVRGKRFDLILRTRDGLPNAMRGDILQIFQDANEAAGYKGALTFQASRDWSLIPLEAADATHAGLVV